MQRSLGPVAGYLLCAGGGSAAGTHCSKGLPSCRVAPWLRAMSCAAVPCHISDHILFASWIHGSFLSLQVGPSVSWHHLVCHLDLPSHVGE